MESFVPNYREVTRSAADEVSEAVEGFEDGDKVVARPSADGGASVVVEEKQTGRKVFFNFKGIEFPGPEFLFSVDVPFRGERGDVADVPADEVGERLARIAFARLELFTTA